MVQVGQIGIPVRHSHHGIAALFCVIVDYVPCPLFENDEIHQQPADFLTLTSTYANAATSFIKTKAGKDHKTASTTLYSLSV
jgi:hypothetical protein